MLRFNASKQVQQQNPTWDLDYIKSVLMLNIVINLVNKPRCFYWYKLVRTFHRHLFVWVCTDSPEIQEHSHLQMHKSTT